MTQKFNFATIFLVLIAISFSAGSCRNRNANSTEGGKDILLIRSSNFSAGFNMEARGDYSNTIQFVIEERDYVPFNQSVVKQSQEQASYGPGPDIPYFTVRFAVSIPPAYTET